MRELAKYWINYLFKKALYGAILLAIGQYYAPYPFDVSWKSHLPSASMIDTSNFTDEDFGYTDEERSKMNDLVKDALPD